MVASSNGETDETLAWAKLTMEFDAWAAAGQMATLFWRDDDATRPGPALDRLLAVTAVADAPLMLAVIPARSESALADAISPADHVRPTQHGWAHVNHARGSGDKGAWELGLHRGMKAVFCDLQRGRLQLTALFGARFLPVVVPPWNRIDKRLYSVLAEVGWRGVSAFGERTAAQPAVGLTVNNAHVDTISWKGGARFAGTATILARLVDHLAARRVGSVDSAEVTGLLTHHADLDHVGWAFVERLGATVATHPAARWCDPADIFPAG